MTVDADERSAPDHLQVAGEPVGYPIQLDIVLDRARSRRRPRTRGQAFLWRHSWVGGDDCNSPWQQIADRQSPDRHRYDGRAVPAELADAAAALERIWRAHVRPLVPDALVDVHAHLGEDASDGSRLDLRRLLASMDAGGVTRTCAFPFQSPRGTGYAAANAEVLAAAGAAAGASLAFCRSEPGERFLRRADRCARRRRARHQAAHEPARLRLLAPAARRRLRAGRRAARADAVPHGPRRAAARARPRGAARAQPGRAGRARALRDRRPARGLRAAPPEHPLRHVALERARRARAARRGRARAGALRLRRALLHADRHAGQALPPARRRWARARSSAAMWRRAAQSACWRASPARG